MHMCVSPNTFIGYKNAFKYYNPFLFGILLNRSKISTAIIKSFNFVIITSQIILIGMKIILAT